MLAPVVPRLAIAAISAVVLVAQIAATRLLSATISYHGAFAVLALVMLALAGSASAVYRDRSRANTLDSDLPAAIRAIWAGPILAATAIGYIVVGSIPWPAGWFDVAHANAAAVGLYASFYACGYVVAWLLSSWPQDVGRVYFADLCGAALGCLLAVPVLAVASPVQILAACGVLTTVAGLALGRGNRQLMRRYAWLAVAVGAITAIVFAAPSLARLRTAKVADQSSVLFERWNQLARVTVSPEMPGTLQAIALLARTQPPAEAEAQVRRWGASGWAVSDRWQGVVPKALWIQLDTDAGTQILERGGTRPLAELDVLGWDVTAAAYWLRPGGLHRAFIVGGGGGRDFLTALMFGAKSVDVVELNPLVVEAVQERFGEFSGRPYSRAGVRYRIGDARSELSRSATRYDLIQMSMIDTWAASMTGALTLSENALYTREAFQAYLDHLTDDGIFTVSRWYSQTHDAETARVLSLMGDALRSAGQMNPADHVAVVFNHTPYSGGVATCMMKRSAFTSAERDVLVKLSRDTGFGVLWPQISGVTVHHQMDVAGVLSGQASVIVGGQYDLSPPTDDRPFFFNTSRLFRVPDGKLGQVTVIFGSLLGAILVASAILVFDPLRTTEALRPLRDRVKVADARAEIAYFAAIGASFMGVELGLLQRYIVFLGHPTYALSVVLFSLLVSTAVGSYAVSRRPDSARRAFPLLLIGLTLTAFGVPALLQAWHAWPFAGRLAVATALIVPLGVCMGTAFPSGVNALRSGGHERLVPWMWAVNGLAGTAASVAGMLMAMELGYTALLLASTVGYGIAWAAWPRFATSAA